MRVTAASHDSFRSVRVPSVTGQKQSGTFGYFKEDLTKKTLVA